MVDGLDEDGENIPDIPIVYLSLESEIGRARGPAIIDTGFDGGIYPNAQILKILRDQKPVKIKHIESPVYGRVSCEVFEVKASVLERKTGQLASVGKVYVYVPTEPEYISDEVLVGREILNNHILKLDGGWIEIIVR